ncbi:hypothetical protein TBLA_0G00270 [Henningerozyma blattae CBS 6284]|uniref:Mannosyltransferase n=1 Tax=Henningerozyma blattae (strain ATCC 34711 / CBS 6284 / DSM 70876 / NBRC 10599 / NRRL Y-10934 / UCD 77-7) TaxID=1071380 RepID=I2H6H4_HENB6|nr:hypothetical protein TBLA_0G00270 [Tetrapisispora blattae CBS 6284]CCH61976.1 hypothetical protein TBLA_0G00270 [Tetrapisispora blattae CBS 6284]
MSKGVTITLLLLLATSRLFFQPLYSLISDCDETFNYWEPLNLLVNGFGKQTWEYSPEYAIRSWAFLSPFAFILKPFNWIFPQLDNVWSFYLVRFTLGLVSFIWEYLLHLEIATSLSPTSANIWLLFQVFNPGWFHASVELLPSSVAMLLYLISIKYAINYLSRDNYSSFLKSLGTNFLAGLLGWPFVLIQSLPLCLHYFFNHNIMWTLRTAFDSTVLFITVAIPIISFDSILYGKFAPVSWNILFYNVLNASDESGPNIFGVEPWYYYIQNIILNFPLPMILFSLIGLINWKLWPLWLTLISWVLIFIAQPHKEERFLYPIYPLITLSATVGFHKLTILFNCKNHHNNKNRFLKLIFTFVSSLFIILQSISRIVALILNYTAPLSVYFQLSTTEINPTNIIQNVCTGREWYHYPTSFFLPDNMRLKFIKSGFNGLLPGDFIENTSIVNQIRTIPQNMNNMNLFESDKIIPVEHCNYFIDIMQPIDINQDSMDPFDLQENTDWKTIKCSKFIDVDNSKILGRTFYLPQCITNIFDKFLPENKYWKKIYGTKYFNYCLFEKIEGQSISDSSLIESLTSKINENEAQEININDEL